ncbi:hypothetical protein [Kushneria aurantia]|uniref:Peptidoglycan-binding protein n=1 Tax=Kushneria aurantia TaxID=504092 RepID=A0ABV6G8D4_9GAMM|nr:hypothetical protein [Kushneria aurantia]
MGGMQARRGYAAALLLLAAAPGAAALAESEVVRLSPQIRFLSPEAAVTPIDTTDIATLLEDYRVVEQPLDDSQGRIVAGRGGEVISGAGDEVVALGVAGESGQRYGIYQPGRVLQDEDGRFLGRVMLPLGEAQLVRRGEPLSVLRITRSRREIGEGARLLPAMAPPLPAQLSPRPAPSGASGSIVDRPGDGLVIGNRDLVMITTGRGAAEPGTLYSVLDEPEPVTDAATGQRYRVPGELLGQLMVLRTFGEVSLALVTRMSRPMAVGDRLGAPADGAP